MTSLRRLTSLLALALAACASNPKSVSLPAARVQDPKFITDLPGYRTQTLPDTVFGGHVHLREAGPPTAPALLLVHGLGDDGARDFFPILPALARNHHVYALDLPGFGGSTHAAALYSPANYVHVLHEVVRPRIAGAFAVVGHSLGGAIALEYAHRHPEAVTRLALIDVAGILHRSALLPLIAAANIGNLFEPAQGVVGTLTGIVVDRAIGPDRLLEDDFTRGHLLSSPTQIAAAALIVHNFGAAIAELRTDTLVIWGRHDAIAPLRTATLLSSRLPNAQLRILERSGHVPMQSEPEAVARVLEDWLQAPRAVAPVDAAKAAPFGRCEKTDGMQFEGTFRQIDVIGCGNVLMRNVRAEAIRIWDSQVVVEATWVNGTDVALRVARSRVDLTGCVIAGNTALRVEDSDLDVAGSALNGKVAAVRSVKASRILFSASSIASPAQHGYVHDIVELRAGQGM